jgi:hypothetical protein
MPITEAILPTTYRKMLAVVSGALRSVSRYLSIILLARNGIAIAKAKMLIVAGASYVPLGYKCLCEDETDSN